MIRPMADSSDSPHTGGSLRSGLVTNYLAFAVVAASGLALNFIVLAAAGKAALGVFSQSYVVFVIAAQPAAAGLHHAVMQRVSRQSQEHATGLLRAGLRCAAPTALATAALGVVAAPLVAHVLGSPDLRPSLQLAMLGLPFHAMNKVAIGYVNGLGRMHHFAGYQLTRALGMAGALMAIAAFTDSSAAFGACFLCSEVVLTLVLVLTLPRPAADVRLPADARALRRFGWSAMTGGLVQEVNARVDVLVIALFLDDDKVGVFAIASTIIEGSFQLLVVLRNNLNPRVARSHAAHRPHEVDELARRLRRVMLPVSLVAWAAVAVACLPVLSLAGQRPDLDGLYIPLVVMLGGLALASPVVPFDQILLVGGRPLSQSVLMAGLLAINVAANFAFVPTFGLVGAA